jgi:hypothetical protein
MGGELHGFAALCVHNPQISPRGKGDLLSIGRGRGIPKVFGRERKREKEEGENGHG